MNRITARRIADHFKGKRVDVMALPDSDDDEAPFGRDPAEDPEVGAVETGMVVDQLMGELNPDHQRVVELCLRSYPAADVCQQVVGMTEPNVHQIASRFRARLREDSTMAILRSSR